MLFDSRSLGQIILCEQHQLTVFGIGPTSRSPGDQFGSHLGKCKSVLKPHHSADLIEKLTPLKPASCALAEWYIYCRVDLFAFQQSDFWLIAQSFFSTAMLWSEREQYFLRAFHAAQITITSSQVTSINSNLRVPGLYRGVSIWISTASPQ